MMLLKIVWMHAIIDKLSVALLPNCNKNGTCLYFGTISAYKCIDRLIEKK